MAGLHLTAMAIVHHDSHYTGKQLQGVLMRHQYLWRNYSIPKTKRMQGTCGTFGTFQQATPYLLPVWQHLLASMPGGIRNINNQQQ
jgi:hypothetical protein